MVTPAAKASDVIAKGSKSFASAARLFAVDKRESVHQLYVWCRHCDDEIDGETLGYGDTPFDRPLAAARLEDLRAATADAIAGRARTGPFLALQDVIAKHAIPPQYPLDLIAGMAMDVEGAPFETIDDVLRYSYHVAGSVGVMMAIILDVRDRPTLQRASDLGIAFQLTNIARDVVSDAERGRVYLPATWLLEAGVSPENVADADARPHVFPVAARLLQLGDSYYRSASVGIDRLPVRSAWAIGSALRIYSSIGEQLLHRGPRAWSSRIATGKAAKLGLTALAAVDVLSGRVMRRRGMVIAREGLWTPSTLEVRPQLAPAD